MGSRGRPILLRSRRRCPLFVKQLRNSLLPDACRRQLEYAAHHRSFGVVDAPLVWDAWRTLSYPKVRPPVTCPARASCKALSVDRWLARARSISSNACTIEN